MKYIKTYEGAKYLKKNTTNKFKEGDYVYLTSNFVNGHPFLNISKKPFKVNRIMLAGHHIKANSGAIQRFQYNISTLDDTFFQWVNEDSLRPATEEEIDIIKYNL